MAVPNDLVLRWLEAAAQLIRVYEVQFVPALLQTEKYARVIITQGAPGMEPDEVYMEYLTGAHYIDKPEEVERYAAVMERLSVAGTSPDRTREILTGMLRDI
jgi:hypothetical protein